jgi:hypothetical protein
MSPMTQEPFKLTSAIRHGTSWADQEHSPGWSAKSPPKFSEELPEVVLDEEEYDRLPRSATATGRIPVFVGGLDYNLEATQLEEFFVSKGCKVSRVRILKTNGKSSGKALMNVPDEAGLTAVIRLSGTMLSGRALIIREDTGPKPSSRKSDKKVEESWRSDSNHKPKKESGWQSVSKGGKVIEAPRTRRTEKREEQAPANEEIPQERKKLELKPRSKPLPEIPEAADSARSSAIFGEAKPRDERVFVKEEAPKEPKTVKRKEKPKQQPTKEVKVEVPVIAPSKPSKVKKSSNRFAIADDSSSSSDSDDE